MRCRRAAGALLLLSSAVALAAEPVTVGRDARTALGLTVYSTPDLALVRDVRRATVAAGEQELRFDDVPARLDPRTVMLRPADGAPGALAVQEQAFQWDLASTETLLGRWMGREIELVETDDRLRTRVTPATVLRVEGGLVVQIGDRIVPDPPGRLRLPPSGTEVFVRPTLRWRIAPSSAGPATLEATYATSGLGWSADYWALLAADERSVDLTAWVTLVNDSGTSWDDASLTLVAGAIHQAKGPARPMMARAMAMPEAMPAPAPVPGGAFAEGGLSEYHRYALDGRVTLPRGTTTQLPLLAASGVPVERRYEVTGAPHWYRSVVPSTDEGERVPVRAVVVLQNTAAGRLGRPLPAGVVRLWTRDAGGALVLLGEDDVPHVPVDERAELTMGDASELVAYRKQTDWKKIDVEPYQYEAAFQVTLRNRKSAAVTVRVREPVDGQWRVVDSSVPPRPLDARTLGFEVPVPAGGETVLRWRVQSGR